MTSHKLDNRDALKFIFAGNSLFTVLNTKTGNRFTFKVTTPKMVKNKKNEVPMHRIHFVSVLTNPDIYQFIGTCFDTVYKHSTKSNIGSEAQSVQVFQYIIKHLKAQTLVDFVEIWHEGRCGKCGRVLTVPDSIKIGIGPECVKSITDKKTKRQLKLIKLLD